ncbi:lipopolysaccharide biosynthesis protein [Arenibacter certesii]|uniref:Lipopolysaccharide biosynthesis protein n=1 Tax=Arenibacter certesii TaxID=228955 RepID=A0A918IZ95_9FLAO|nr:lipopolysaccharide biosynthesis protein [Arenibacter certesii]GGW38923.1 lipopolysaccharide biosynthesis protein [Arenibacter certesii]
MSLKKKTLYGFIWMSIDVLFLRGLAFVTSIVLARILNPEEFGLVGMIAVLIAIGTTFVDSGLSESLIRTKNTNDKDYSSILIMNLIIAIIIYTTLYFTAPLVSNFYNQPLLTNLIRVYGICFILTALSATQIAILLKKLEFRKLTLLNLPGAIIGSIIGIVLGIKGFGVWSIIFMYIASQAVQTIFLWIFSTWKPSFTFSVEKIKLHFSFGYKLLISGLLNSVFNNVYNVLIGKYFPIKSLGYYERANAFSNQPVSILSSIISKVTYPILANMQEEKEKITKIYKQMFQTTYFLTTPLMILLAGNAMQIFQLILGEKWLGAVPYFQILCVAAIFYPINAFNLNILKVFGRTDLFLRLEIIKKLIIIINVTIGFYFGIYGLLWSSVLSSFLAVMVNGHYSSLIINYSTRNQLLDMLPISLICTAMFLIINYLSNALPVDYGFMRIIISSIIGLLFYLISCKLLKLPVIGYTLNFINPK